MQFRFVLGIMLFAAFGWQIAVSAANRVPNFNIASICKNESGCTQDEQATRDQLFSNWQQFRDTDTSRCVQETSIGGMPSYVELLTCLQADKIKETTPTDPLGPKETIGRATKKVRPPYL